MNKLTTLFVGFFLTFFSAWVGLVIIPYFQIGQLQAFENEDTGQMFPLMFTGLEQRGRQVYQANGCLYCHSQQIRPEHAGSDIERGWGARRSVARDYIYDKPHLMGTMRTGPDLTNVGVRLTSAQWHHEHLYAPQMMASWSTMPPYRYLYRVQKIQGAPSPDALNITGRFAAPEGYEIVPTEDARALVAYLLAMQRNYELPEAPLE